MENKDTILEELRELSPAIADINRSNIFSVPKAYFDDLPEIILARIQAEEVSFGSKHLPFSVPLGYFEGLADNILNKISRNEQSVYDELNEIAPLLNSISKEPVYTIPEGYFESLELTVPLKLDRPSAKVFNFSAKKIFQYAVAACTAGILMIGAYMYSNQNTDQQEMVISYDSALKMNVSNELAETNEEEIVAYLGDSPGVGYNVINASSSEEINVEEYLETATDEEIKEYLKTEYQETGIITTGS